MKGKALMCLAALSMVTSVLSAASWASVLEETEETAAIVERLKVYQVYDCKGPMQMRRLGKEYDGGYVVPERALTEAQVLFGYGVGGDISFEDSVTERYGIDSYGFDCTCAPVKPRQNNCHFVPSCIVKKGQGQDKSVYASFEQHLQHCGAVGKKIFVKMDIEGNEYETMPDILRYASYVTGIVLEIHFHESAKQIPQALDLLSQLDKDFVLVHLHGNNCCRDVFRTSHSTGDISRVLELTYINRALVERAELASDQTHPQAIDMINCQSYPDITFSILE